MFVLRAANTLSADPDGTPAMDTVQDPSGLFRSLIIPARPFA
ncbi:MAG: hypothetical protein U1F36_17520 [Planctomycetota bacterium]